LVTDADKNSNDMEDKIFYIITDLLREDISKQECVDALLNLCVVTGSFGVNKEPTLTTLKRTEENRHVTVCDLCIFDKECEFNEIKYNKCLTDNTDEQYYQ